MSALKGFLKPLSLREMQAKLDALPGSDNNNFEDNTWQFENQRGRTILIDFNDLIIIEENYSNWPLAQNGNLIFITKQIWLALAISTTVNGYSPRLSGIKLFLSTLAHHNLTELTRNNLPEVLEFMMLRSWLKNGFRKNLSIKSYNNFAVSIQIKSWKLALTNIGLNLISREVTESSVKKQLQQLIPKLTDEELSYRDWLKGGTYNLLTLDHGRYYVEHCLSFFENQYPMAIALASTFRAAPELAASLGYKTNTVSEILSQVIQGNTAESLSRRWPTSSLFTLQKVHECVTNYYQSAYQQARFEYILLKDSTINQFITACGLQESPENIDRMRVILWDWMRRKDKQETQALLKECQPPVSWGMFQQQLTALQNQSNQEPCPLPKEKTYKALGLTANDHLTPYSIYPRQLIRLVASAGMISMVALTGWRKSELGFPRSAIKRSMNSDKLDQYAFPWRYQVDWHVYKTSGKVRQMREISFSTFLIAEKLQLLFNIPDDQPCLYEVIKTKVDPFKSENPVQRQVTNLWRHFVYNYAGFKQLDDWTAFQQLQVKRNEGLSLTHAEQQKLSTLLNQKSEDEWINLQIDNSLKEAWRRTRDEWPRLEFFFWRSTNECKKDWLVHYQNRTLRPDWIILLDKHLSEETKDWVQSLPEEELRLKTATKSVMKNLIENTLYPSSHAFRHMWAEAVYRRFDGDAGWMIRSQFKHISRAMWLAYIRDKDNRFSHQRAKTQVISSLVQNYFKNKGEGYSGQLHSWLRRLFKKTAILTPQEQILYAEKLATVEFQDLKANPWGYCLLKRRTRNKAKCAEMGEPMRHNASPDLCLGCAHNLMQSENVEWSIFHASSHMEALKNPIVPAVFKKPSYKLIKNVTKQVEKMNSQHEALPELIEVLDIYKVSETN